MDVTSLPAYYGLTESAWKHWSRVWGVDYEWVKSRFVSQKFMEAKGIPTTRWFDAVLAKPDEIEQPAPVKAMVVFGHGGNTVTRMPEMRRRVGGAGSAGRRRPAPDDLRVGQRAEERDLSAADLHPVRGGRVAHGVQPLDPVGRPGGGADLRVEERLRRHVPAGDRLGFAAEMFKHIKVVKRPAGAEDILREINYGSLSTGYSGQSPERLQASYGASGGFRPDDAEGSTGALRW